MSEFLKAYDSDHDFNRNAYFTLCYNMIPSEISFSAPLASNKSNLNAVFETIEFATLQMEEVYKKWDTNNEKNAIVSKDFPREYLFKSQQKKLAFWVSLSHNHLTTEFLYDGDNAELEHWVTTANHALRTTFGETKGASFQVLCKDGSCFYTQDVKTRPLTLDVAKMYNDGFEEVNQIIFDAMKVDKAGLILLHGTPGTGKTSYIKGLITAFPERDFIFIQNEFITELLRPEFISFLLNYQNAVLVIEDAEKVITTRESSNANSVVSTILQLTDGLFSDYLSIKIICTFNTNIEKIDKALLRKGRMIAAHEFKPLSTGKTKALMHTLGNESVSDELTLAEIFAYDEKGYEALTEA